MSAYSASLYSRASANGGSYTYAPTTKVMNMFEPDDKRTAISIDMQETTIPRLDTGSYVFK